MDELAGTVWRTVLSSPNQLSKFKELIESLESLVGLTVEGNCVSLAGNAIAIVKNYANELFARTSKFAVVNGEVDSFAIAILFQLEFLNRSEDNSN